MGTYLPFEGIALADTFELFEGQQRHIMFTQENTERVERQKAADMFVVIGNPPYNIQGRLTRTITTKIGSIRQWIRYCGRHVFTRLKSDE